MSFNDRMMREAEKADDEAFEARTTPMTKAEWDEMMKEISADRDAREFDPFRADEQASQAFIDSAKPKEGLCIRWGSGPDSCIRPFDHLGPCADLQGRTTLTLAAEILGRKK